MLSKETSKVWFGRNFIRFSTEVDDVKVGAPNNP
jgi:hypothetical protein